MEKLTLKQKKFCEYYAISGNATEAATKAGYSKKTAYACGAENLKKPQIAAYIKKMADKQSDKRIMSSVERKELLTKIANEEKNTFAKLKALDLLNKMTGEYIEKHEVTIHGSLADLLEGVDNA